MKYIKLTNSNKRVIVNNEEYLELKDYNWRLHNGYAVRSNRQINKIRLRPTLIRMHRVIAKTPKGLFVDHINFNRLDNRKTNLRNISKKINNLHRKPSKINTSGYKGVSYSKRDKGWYAKARINGKTTNLGLFRKITGSIKTFFLPSFLPFSFYLLWIICHFFSCPASRFSLVRGLFFEDYRLPYYGLDTL